MHLPTSRDIEERIPGALKLPISKDMEERLLRVIYPRCCPVCGEITVWPDLCCPSCRKKLHYIKEPTCMRCGKELISPAEEFCYDCARRHPSFRRGYAVFNYASVQQGLLDLKFRGRREYADFFADEIARFRGREILSVRPEAIIPVPMYRRKQRKRGYNQAELIARGVGERLAIPVRTDILVRSHATIAQKKLSNTERFRNLEAAFAAEPCGLSRVILLDDIYTTGATAEACTRALMRSGIREVYVVCAAIGEGF